MKRDIANLLITALESGAYKHAERVLKYETDSIRAFCVAGVLCDLYRRETGHGQFVPLFAAHLPYQKFKVDDDDAPTRGGIPLSVREWAGLTDVEVITLITENDRLHGGANFASVLPVLKAWRAVDTDEVAD